MSCLALSTLTAVPYHASISSSWKKEEGKPPTSALHLQAFLMEKEWSSLSSLSSISSQPPLRQEPWKRRTMVMMIGGITNVGWSTLDLQWMSYLESSHLESGATTKMNTAIAIVTRSETSSHHDDKTNNKNKTTR